MVKIHVVAVGSEGEMAYPHDAVESGCWFYLHGKLESQNHYDIVSFIKGTKPKEAGIFDCMVHMNDGSFIPSKLYCYFDKYRKDSLRGLIVSNFEDFEVIQEVAKHAANGGED